MECIRYQICSCRTTSTSLPHYRLTSTVQVLSLSCHLGRAGVFIKTSLKIFHFPTYVICRFLFNLLLLLFTHTHHSHTITIPYFINPLITFSGLTECGATTDCLLCLSSSWSDFPSCAFAIYLQIHLQVLDACPGECLCYCS